MFQPAIFAYMSQRMSEDKIHAAENEFDSLDQYTPQKMNSILLIQFYRLK